MKKSISACIIAICCLSLSAQKPSKRYINPEVIQGTYVKTTIPIRDIIPSEDTGKPSRELKLGYHPKDDWQLNEILNPNAKPNGMDPALQTNYSAARPFLKTLDLNIDGLDYTFVNPPDPAIDVGPNHIIQMINAGGGSEYEIRDKQGNNLAGPALFDDVNFTNIPGAGDPIVLYDQFADRWLMSEFGAIGNRLIVAISQTADPTGSWYVYSYVTNQFPDYPKYSIWNDMYVVTSNESAPRVYAMDRTAMLSGSAGTIQTFTAPSFGTIIFQALAPVDVDGPTGPSSSDPALLMRMADDAWSMGPAQDQLEIFELDIDFSNSNNSSLTQVLNLQTQPFDTELCGYTAFACIEQSGSTTTLDPLRELLMNKVQYRKFASHESIVACHVTDVNGNDRAGIRWYELRKSGSSDWSIYQQGTYSPDTESRWMCSIAINSEGTIGLAYSTSSSSTFPSLKYTGRKECDNLGEMTEPETTIVTGSSPNGSNRYGDYAAMGVDPNDDSFWFTGQYVSTNSEWATRIAQFSIEGCANDPEVEFEETSFNINEADANVVSGCLDYTEVIVTIGMPIEASVDPTVTLTLGGNAVQDVDYEAPVNLSATLTSSNLSADFTFKIFDDNYVEIVESLDIGYTLNANGGDATAGANNQMVTIEITSDDIAPTDITSTVTVLSENFETNTLGVFTTVNPSGDTPFQAGDETTASSLSFTIPTPPTGTYFSYINDDDCDCDQGNVLLESPVFSLDNSSGADLTFDFYYEDNASGGAQENAEVLISTNGGSSYSSLFDLPEVTGWTNQNIDLSTYLGETNLKIAFRYQDDGGWMWGLAVDNVEVTKEGNLSIQDIVNTGSATEANFGPNETVHFYDETSGSIMLSLINTSNHDFGCTTVEVDRAGTSPGALQFATTNANEFVSNKTFKISPTNANSSATYDIELYFTDAELVAWETATGESRTVAEIVKVGGNNAVSDVNPSNFGTFNISYTDTDVTAFGSDWVIKSMGLSGFSGFAIGKEILISSCGTTTWIGPSVGNWNDSASNWSLNEIPTLCQDVVIPAGNNVTVQNNQVALGRTLDVAQGAVLEVKTTAEMTIVNE